MWFTPYGVNNQSSNPDGPNYQDLVDAMFARLEEWFGWMQDDLAQSRLPDPSYKPPRGYPKLTHKVVDQLIKEMDEDLDVDGLGVQGRNKGREIGCDFWRLDYPQRLALAQDIQQLIYRHNKKNGIKPAPKKKPARDDSKEPYA